MISKFDYDSERFKIAVDLRNELLIRKWLIDFLFLCERHSDYLHEEKYESNAILWKITDKTIRNENVKKIEVIFENKNYSRSSQSKNLILSKLVHFQNDHKISFERNENLKNIFCKNFTNQWKDRKFRSMEFAANLRLSAKNWIIKLRSSYLKIRHSLYNCETCSSSEKSRFESCDDRK